jgi:hypothetical protein
MINFVEEEAVEVMKVLGEEANKHSTKL